MLISGGRTRKEDQAVSEKSKEGTLERKGTEELLQRFKSRIRQLEK
jgi:hypothetical protein